MDSKRIVVIGGGAAGFFSAIDIGLQKTGFDIEILEKTNKLLSKVKISGGGQCNVTHHCFDISELVKNYPRGHKELRQVFSRFNVEQTIDWFKQQGVNLKTEEDGRMFPVTDDSQTIIDCFMELAASLKIKIKIQCEVFLILPKKEGFEIKTSQGVLRADSVICASGGHHKSGAYDFIKNLGHTIDSPIPSLFTINLPNENIRKELQGLSVKYAEVKIEDTKLSYKGPVLITHWGLSGPAVLKLSAFAATEFFQRDYQAKIKLNWVHPLNQEQCELAIKEAQKEKHRALPYSNPLFDLPKRLWEFLCESAGINNSKPWAEINNKHLRALAVQLTSTIFKMEGKTTFKEEFVTCGGVNLKEINFKRMESKIVPGLFFCGEVINCDGITGGFNFQSAWSTAWICATTISE